MQKTVAEKNCAKAKDLLLKSTLVTDTELVDKFVGQSVNLYLDATKQEPYFIEPYIALANLCIQYSQYDHAFNLLDQASQIAPDYQAIRHLYQKLKSKSTKRKNIKEQLSAHLFSAEYKN